MRASKSVTQSGVTTNTNFVWSGSDMVYEYNSSSTTTGNQYIYGNELLWRRVEGFSHALVYHYNYRGDVINSCRYDAFGNEITASTDTDPFRYCGEYYDFESGNIYLRARYYNPQLGRFTQQDGWEYMIPDNPQSLNLYSYCHNNPVRYVDPTGNMAIEAAVAATNWWNPVGWASAILLAVEVVVVVVVTVVAVEEVVEAVEDSKKNKENDKSKSKDEKQEREFKEKVADKEKNPKDWKKTGESTEASTKKGNKGGKSIETEYTNKKTGEKIWEHTLEDSIGKTIEKHYRPYPKQ